MRAKRFEPGTRVRFTGKFLRNTGQYTGQDTRSRWTVVPCECGLCKLGNFLATDEPSYDDPSQPRHINVGNLQRCRS